MVAIKAYVGKHHFVVGMYNIESKDYKFVEIDNLNNGYKYLLALFKSLAKENIPIISFGGKHYDLPIIQFLVKNRFEDVRPREIVYLLNRFHSYITHDDKWWLQDEYRTYKYNSYTSIDLMYYSNKGLYDDVNRNIKRTETNDIEIVKKYLKNDLYIIAEKYESHKEDIHYRMLLEQEFDVKGLLDISVPQIMEKIIGSAVDDHTKLFEDRNTSANVFDIADKYSYNNHEINTFKDYLMTNKVFDKKHGINYSFVINDTSYTIKSGILKANSVDRGYIEDVYIADVVSMYPTMLLKNEIVPKHIDKDIFLAVYKKVYDMKILHNNKLFKHMLVSMVGYFNSESCKWLKSYQSWIDVVLESTMYMLSIIDTIIQKGYKILFVNLDSICFSTMYNDFDESILNGDIPWNVKYYDSMILKDYNNYIAIGDDDKVSGVFNTENKYPIIGMAVKQYLKYGDSYSDFIKNHDNIYDFCTIYDTPTDTDVMYNSEIIQNTNRVYVSKKGNYLYKVKGKNIVRITKEKVCLYNAKEYNYDINYDWYIGQVEKLLINQQTQQTLF